mmetsp:Transcript_54/g.62  ORF Transcript_54/g.62 Transcript_54/m.62 type:complete len:292 (-) Transcript_54:131-1006(-)|eukprot:CAMPEP_0184023372 /NCGR_PEP_ID=MMETSP0954-20121128/11325_1 /TAXON_ID=627963 /ORGANISM="Aplanochytrium sp, Strain PBS07" /LENGTH=291 /DNA_ID=CAMNT_0026306251 /DNA_START=141 /DNA_END=1016 /DNA_ORIENTATION=+
MESGYQQVGGGDAYDVEKPRPPANQYNGVEHIPIAQAVGSGHAEQGYQSYLMGDRENDTPLYVYIEDLDKVVRQGFVRKVFSILGIQLAVTFGSILFSVNNASMNNFLSDPDRSGWFVGLGLFFLIMSTIMIACCTHLTRRHPHNIILLSIYTVAQSMLLSTITVAYDVAAVMIACGTTLAVVVSLIAFASQTKYDFTGMGMYLYVALWTLILFGFIASFSNSDGMQLVYAALGTLIFSFYIVYDTQLILGGNHKMRFSIDDYVLAALMLYIDIIELFLFILRLIGDSRDR